ncbi:hypothetical protein Ahy_B03g067086 isoform B [Arachis hypogaea]|uniref:Uncharacterized protein n=1 Tax=Arachis hypogaea TaxID=3818 RepID=A0A445A5Q9_ARAHY|nr:hypothetical protein Ahy_B03g067086 isoform B [Arachis hypogaea]
MLHRGAESLTDSSCLKLQAPKGGDMHDDPYLKFNSSGSTYLFSLFYRGLLYVRNKRETGVQIVSTYIDFKMYRIMIVTDKRERNRKKEYS